MTARWWIAVGLVLTICALVGLGWWSHAESSTEIYNIPMLELPND